MVDVFGELNALFTLVVDNYVFVVIAFLVFYYAYDAISNEKQG